MGIRSRIRNGNPWIREPMAPVRENDEGEVAPDEEGPTMSMEFLQYNTVILHEMADCWGLKPKIGKGRIQKEVGRGTLQMGLTAVIFAILDSTKTVKLWIPHGSCAHPG